MNRKKNNESLKNITRGVKKIKKRKKKKKHGLDRIRGGENVKLKVAKYALEETAMKLIESDEEINRLKIALESSEEENKKLQKKNIELLKVVDTLSNPDNLLTSTIPMKMALEKDTEMYRLKYHASKKELSQKDERFLEREKEFLEKEKQNLERKKNSKI